MQATSGFRSREGLTSSLERKFSARTVWPIEYCAMSALIDMGLSDAKIARYFAVSVTDVTALRIQFQLRENMI